MTARSRATLACAVLLLLSAAAGAHHSVWAEFDQANPMEMRGRFQKMDWINPHSWVHFEMTLPDGSTEVWAAETPPPNQLIRQGWRRSDLKPGDEIVIKGYAARNGTKRVWAQNVTIVAQNGQPLAEPRTVLALFEANPEGVPEGLLPGRE